MAIFRVKLVEIFYTEADSLEEAYSMYENDADYCEIEEVEED